MADILRVLARKVFPPLFTIRIREGRAERVQGKVTPAFLDDCSGISRRSGITSGWIWGHLSPSGVRLEFSSGIGEGDRQRFRNTAGVHGK
ncbi:MAG: hypothetical protein AVO35_05975 [Candidatus Aegiribacteria sp. MLS_C]|nr:MAG: hypothetical protein AVO35_05975 [Candidatus Aegiribacteria sp. MLS_C]